MSGLNPYAAALPTAPPEPQASANPYAAAVAPSNPYAPALHAPQALDQARSALGSLKRGYFDLAAEPMKAVDAVLGAPRRFVQGAAAYTQRHGGLDAQGIAHDSRVGELGAGAYHAFHPNDSEHIQGEAEKLVGVDRLKTNDPRFRGKLRNFAVDFGFDLGTDALTAAGGPAAKVAGAAMRPVFSAAGRALAQHAPGAVEAGQRAVNYVRPKAHVELDPLLHREGRNLVLGAKESEASVEARQAMEDAALLKAEKGNLQKGVISPAMRKRLLWDRYTHGTPEVRQKALDAGYVPAEGEAAKAPTGLYQTFLENYEPKQAVYDGVKMEHLGFGKHQLRHEPFAGFELPQGAAEQDLATLPERMAQRLKAGRGVTRNLMTEKRVREGLGLAARDVGSGPVPSQAVFAEAAARRAKYVKDRAALQEYLDAGKLRGEITGRLPLLKTVSDVSRDVMFSDPSSFAHEGNISEAAFLSGGLGNVARGIGHYLNPRGVPAATTEAMEEAGAMSHFTRQAPPKWSPARLAGPLRDVKSRMLDRFDTSMRASDWKRVQAEVARERGPLPINAQERAMEEEARQYEAATRVRQNMGDYRNPSQLTEDLRGLGGRFPQWRLGIVPGMVGRAAAKNPQRIEQLARVQDDANQDVWNPGGYSMDPGKPVNDMAKLAVNPMGYALGSSSSLGPLVDAVHAADNIRHPDSIDTGPKELAAMARGYIPFAQRAEDAMGWGPYPSKAPREVRTAAGMVGAYPTAPGGIAPKERTIRNIMQTMRVNRYVAEHVIYPRLFRH